MTIRFIHALDIDNSDAVVATHTETNDTVFTWDIPTIFPNLPNGNFAFVLNTAAVGTYTVLAGSTIFLDEYPGATGAFSLRQLSSNYTGPVVRVERSDDSAERDFTASEVEDGTLVNWITTNVATSDGLIVYPYNQTGAGNEVATPVGKRSKIVSNGVLKTRGGKPIMDVSVPGDEVRIPLSLTNLQDHLVIAASYHTGLDANNKGGWIVAASDDWPDNNVHYMKYGDFFIGRQGDFVAAPPATAGTINVTSIASDAGSYEFSINGTAFDSGVHPDRGAIPTSRSSAIGNFPGGAPAEGETVTETESEVFEVIIYDTAQTDNLNGMRQNLADYYGATLPVSGNPSAIGGVTKGTVGAPGSIYDGFKLSEGDDFDAAPTRWHGANLSGEYAHSQPARGFRGTQLDDECIYMTPEYKGPRSESLTPLGVDGVSVSNSIATFTAQPVSSIPGLSAYMPDNNTPNFISDGPTIATGGLKTWPKFMFSSQADFIIEARVKTQPGVVTGYWPSVWTVTEIWPDLGEFDLLEVEKDTTTGASIYEANLNGVTNGSGAGFVPLGRPIGPDGRWVHLVGVKQGNEIIVYDDIANEGTLVERTRSSHSIVSDMDGPHDVRLDLAISNRWDGSTMDFGTFPASFEIDWWRAWVPAAASLSNEPTEILTPIFTTPGGSWAASLPAKPAGAGRELAVSALDNWDAPGAPGSTRTSAPEKWPEGMTVDYATRAITGTVPTTEGGATGLLYLKSFDDGSPVKRIMQPYYVAPAVQELPASWSVPTGGTVNIVIDFVDFHSGNLGPHTYNVTASGLTVSGNGTTEATITGTAPSSNVTVTIDCTNTVGQTTTVTRDIVVSQ